MSRSPGWHGRLNKTIESFRHAPLRYGAADCAIFSLACIKAVTGSYPEGFDQKWLNYGSEEQALLVIKAAGFSNLGDLASHCLKELLHPSMAVTGDIAAIPTENEFGYALGVVSLDNVFVFGQGYDGLGLLKLNKMTRAFQV